MLTPPCSCCNPQITYQVAAVGDAERGKQGALNAFLAERQHLRPPREETDRLRTEVRLGWVGPGRAGLSFCMFTGGRVPGGGGLILWCCA